MGFLNFRKKSFENGSWKEQASDEGRKEGPEEKDRRPFHPQGMVRRQGPRYGQHQRHLQDARQQDRRYSHRSDSLKGRVYEVSLADLQNDEVAFRKFRLICEDVQGRNCLTNFHGMPLTPDKTRSMVKKWQSMIEARVDVKTSDGYTLRLFCVGFTKKRQNQIKKTSYAQTQQVKNIRRKMVDIITKEVGAADLKETVNK